MNKRKLFIILGVIMGFIFFIFIVHHYYIRHQAEEKIDEYIAAYHFPRNKVVVGKIYEPMKQADTFVIEVHVKSNEDNYYVFAYNTVSKTIDLSRVINGEWFGLDEGKFKQMKFQPSEQFIEKYQGQNEANY